MDVIVLNFVNHRQVENKSGANEDEEHIMCHVLSQATSGQRPAARHIISITTKIKVKGKSHD